ncbi:MerR family transcriptional regulator [Falsirhodobacter sp. alg1]|uniref:MerR family transcriptional regulator n=1 Tax=Falsirhodobacter sp. alg1 TaxID=1472418 RepID=UPI0005F08E19|nr:MerR family transcriptional regulator [Falsirhodobacter sp. alg1]
MGEPMLNFKEMCAKFQVTPRTLRYYEYIELLVPHKEGRMRFYGDAEVRRMEVILRGKRFGFSLEEIRQWLITSAQQGDEEQKKSLVKLADRKLEELENQRALLDIAIADLRELRAASISKNAE